MSREERLIIKILKPLLDLSIEEIESLRPLWLKEVENAEISEELQHSCNKFLDLITQFKQKELGEEYAENASSAGRAVQLHDS